MFSSWMTTVLGQVLGILMGIVPMISTGKIDWMHVGIYAGNALLGAVAKDFNRSNTGDKL